MLEFILISFMASEFMFDLLPAVSSGTGMEWGWNKYWRGWVGMETKSAGWVGMGVISVAVHVQVC